MLTIWVNKSKATAIPVAVNTASRVAVNFRHNIAKNELTIIVKSHRQTILQFFLFTPDGILVEKVAVSAQRTAIVLGLKRGLYLYECFDNDERMKSGSLLIK
jgi:hypothetical protein